MSDDAIDVKPEIRLDKAISGDSAANVETLVLDSGEEDLNRTVARKKVPCDDVEGLEVSGFSSPVFFNDEQGMLDAIKMLSETSKEDALSEFKLPDSAVSLEKTSYCLTYGDINIVYAGKENSLMRIASPVYQIHADKKGNYLPFIDIRNYIKNTWQVSFFEAISHENDSIEGRLSKKKRGNDGSREGVPLYTQIAILVIAVFLAGMAGVATAKVIKADTLNSAQPTSFNAPVLTGLDSSGVMTASTNTPNLQPQMQVDQVKSILKDMNIDLDANAQDMGCFTSE